MKKRQGGFTLIELLIVFIVVVVIFIGGFYFLLFKTVLAGNYWVFEDRLNDKFKLDYPQVEEVIYIDRKVFDPTVVTVEEYGKRATYCIDSNIMQDYEFVDCED
ncbi:MAG: prepilin-type N-terminal cleavage/methylation domain-containing protein [Candidatus Komeilibacteria bacterium]